MIRITLIRMVMNMTTTHRDDSIDDGGLLDGDAQGLHVEVEEGVEDGHGGGLEQEDKLDPNLIRISINIKNLDSRRSSFYL